MISNFTVFVFLKLDPYYFRYFYKKYCLVYNYELKSSQNWYI